MQTQFSLLAVLTALTHFTNVLSVSPPTPSDRPPKDKRESNCLRNAIKFYNLTSDFQEKMVASTKQEYFDELLTKDAVHLRDTMNALEDKLVLFIKQIESWGGVPPKTENSTNEFEQFSLEVDMEYKAMMKKMKENFDKFMEANKSLRAAKQSLMRDSDQFSKLREKYIACAPYLVGAGISLARPHKDLEPITEFDISVLLELEKRYKELSDIEDQVTPIMEKYSDASSIPRDSDDGRTFFRGLDRVEILETIEIKRLIRDNDHMLRHFEGIVNGAVDRARDQIEDVSRTFDRMQQEVIKNAEENAVSDGRIRKLVEKFNHLLEEANAAAIKIAVEKIQKIHSKDEL